MVRAGRHQRIVHGLIEKKLIGAEGAAFGFTLVERCLLAGRIIWFYLGKLFWPHPLIFIYPRWEVSQSAGWQYLFPLAAAMLVAGLWLMRRRRRGPLAGLLFFIGSLFPVLGFFNVYPFVFSFVADHFQYLAGIGVIVVVSAGLTLWLNRQPPAVRRTGQIGCVALVGTLAGVSWNQCRMYRDVKTLYQTTIDRNPGCWLAYNNLGDVLFKEGRLNEAIEHYQTGVRLNPDSPDIHYNLGHALLGTGHLAEGIGQYEAVVRLEPDSAMMHDYLGDALLSAERISEAAAQYEAAVRLKPDFAEAHNNLGTALFRLGKLPEAIDHYQIAVRLEPDSAEMHSNLGTTLLAANRVPEAIAQFETALRLDPNFTDARNNLEIARQAGRPGN